MAVITTTEAQVAPIYAKTAEIFPATSSTAFVKGDLVYFNTSTGELTASDASAPGTDAFVHGLVVRVNGTAYDILVRGQVNGFDLSSLDYGASVYLSNTAKKADTAAGDNSLVVGTVYNDPDQSSGNKVLWFNAPSLA